MKSREVDYKLKGVSIDPRIKAVLMELAEDQSSQRQQIMQLANMLDAALNNMNIVMTVAGNMKDKIEEVGGKSVKDQIERMNPPDETD